MLSVLSALFIWGVGHILALLKMKAQLNALKLTSTYLLQNSNTDNGMNEHD